MGGHARRAATVLVTGAGGQLAAELVRVFDDWHVVALPRGELDVAEEAAVWSALLAVRPQVVVNAAAITDVDACESDPDRAHAVNALGPWWLARACAELGAVLTTISTDYVFGGGPSGTQQRPYGEFDAPAPVNVYGRTKLAGEQLVRQTLTDHQIVRTSWLFGDNGQNFVRTVVERARTGQRLDVVDDQTGSPTYTVDLAEALRNLIVSRRFGTFHRTNSGSCTRYELARHACELAGVATLPAPCTSEAFPRPAPRPAYSVLENRHAVACGLGELPTWRDALGRMIAASGLAQA